MKALTVIFIALFSLFITSCHQQKVNIPEKVQASFTALFPAASDIEWELEGEDEWEAEFEFEGKEVSACFNSEGEWLETEYEIESLPETIETILLETYPGFDINEIEFVESPDFKGYEVELEKGVEELEVLVTQEGEVMMEEMEDEVEEQEEG